MVKQKVPRKARPSLENVLNALYRCGVGTREPDAVPFGKVCTGMVGWDAAVAETGPWHLPINGPLAFAAWLCLHAVLLTTVRAETETLLEWAWDRIGGARVSPILDQQVELPKRSAG